MKDITDNCKTVRILKTCQDHEMNRILLYIDNKYQLQNSTYGLQLFKFVKKINFDHFQSESCQSNYTDYIKNKELFLVNLKYATEEFRLKYNLFD